MNFGMQMRLSAFLKMIDLKKKNLFAYFYRFVRFFPYNIKFYIIECKSTYTQSQSTNTYE